MASLVDGNSIVLGVAGVVAILSIIIIIINIFSPNKPLVEVVGLEET
jgi:hypothetical protein